MTSARTATSSRRQDLAELPSREVRTDIQGMRALAVLLVVAFHLYPQWLPGGYVGVDVFFVLSGFLITSHLLRVPPRRPSEFVAFWGRRIRRLLPASLLVVVVTVVAGVFLLPVSQLQSLGRDALASVLYVENWNLAANAVSYLNASAAVSPLQHYWSLGVEEQFYLVWPFLIALGAFLVSRGRRSAMAWVLLLFVAASLVVSVVWTIREPAAAYFVTPTRLWELGIGGLVALAARSERGARILAGTPDAARAVVAWVAIAVILVSALALNSASPFPGVIALVPVGAAALFIAVDSGSVAFSPDRWMRIRPVQLVGDLSYSIYLWHFPLIILGTAVVGGILTVVPKAIIVVATLVLAFLTKKFVEDPIRINGWLRRGAARTLLPALVVTAVAAAITFLPPLQVQALDAQAAAEKQSIIAANGECLGAAALVTSGCGIRGTGFLPSVGAAHQDLSVAYADGCMDEQPFTKVTICHYGDQSSPKYKIALVGNSHATQWLPALQAIAKGRSISITTYVASGCPPTTAHVVFDEAGSSDGCRSWGQRVADMAAHGGYDLIVTSDASNSDVVGVAPSDKVAPQTAGYRDILHEWAQAGVPVLVIKDTPFPKFDIPDCVASHQTDLQKCSGPRSDWEPVDPLVDAATQVNSPLVKSIDLNDHFCSATTCYAVLGGVIVYFDYMHATATFVTTVAPYLKPTVDSMLGAPAS